MTKSERISFLTNVKDLTPAAQEMFEAALARANTIAIEGDRELDRLVDETREALGEGPAIAMRAALRLIRKLTPLMRATRRFAPAAMTPTLMSTICDAQEGAALSLVTLGAGTSTLRTEAEDLQRATDLMRRVMEALAAETRIAEALFAVTDQAEALVEREMNKGRPPA